MQRFALVALVLAVCLALSSAFVPAPRVLKPVARVSAEPPACMLLLLLSFVGRKDTTEALVGFALSVCLTIAALSQRRGLLPSNQSDDTSHTTH